MEQGQPLHAFDRDKLVNIVGKIPLPEDFSVRKAKNSESLVCLDGNNYSLNENITVIACCDIPIAIAGVIGGLETSVSDSTTSIYLEGAVFNPVSIRMSSKEIGIRTESSSRYEKGISFKNTIDSVTRAINLLDEFFSINSAVINTSNKISEEDLFVKLRRDRIHKILGPIVLPEKTSTKKIHLKKRALTDNEIIDKLILIGCNLINKDYGWDVRVIPHRSQDLVREIDLIEEIARLIGYDKFDLNLPVPIKPGKLSNNQQALRKLKNGFIHNGFCEVLSYSLVPENNNLIRIANPLLVETSCLRDNIWNEHLKIVNRNIKSGESSCWIFEIGNIFNKESKNIQEEILSGAIYGKSKFEKWVESGKEIDLNYFEARGKLKESLSAFNINVEDKQTDLFEFLHPGRSSLLFVEGKDVGYFGEIHPKLILEKKSLKKIYLFSLKVSNLLLAATRQNKWVPTYKQFPTVPKMERDINLIFNKKYIVKDIISQIKRSGKNLLEEVNLIDVFEDKNIGDDLVSYTFRLSYRDSKKTLIESDIINIHSNIISSLENKYNTKLRN